MSPCEERESNFAVSKMTRGDAFNTSSNLTGDVFHWGRFYKLNESKCDSPRGCACVAFMRGQCYRYTTELDHISHAVKLGAHSGHVVKLGMRFHWVYRCTRSYDDHQSSSQAAIMAAKIFQRRPGSLTGANMLKKLHVYVATFALLYLLCQWVVRSIGRVRSA